MKILVALVALAPMATFGFMPSAIFRPGMRRFALHESMEASVKDALNRQDDETKYCIPLEEIRLDDLPKVGG